MNSFFYENMLYYPRISKNKAMPQRMVNLYQKLFLEIDEKNTRKTSETRGRILLRSVTERFTPYFVEFFPSKINQVM